MISSPSKVGKFLLFILLSLNFILPTESFSECRNLGEMLERDNPRVMNYLKSLSDSAIGSEIQGIELCDGSNPLRGLIYQGKVVALPEWHIFLFERKEENRKIAYTWVEKGGKPLPIPIPPDELKFGEHAHVISYDVYTYLSVQPGDDVVIINYPNNAWIKWVTKTRPSTK